MKDIRAQRELVGFSRIALSMQAKVSRTRLQLAEARVLVLRPEEMAAVSQVLRNAMESRAASLRSALLGSNADARG
jgi:hypothetical protein